MSFYKDYEVPQLKSAIAKIYNTYKASIDLASKTTEVPIQIIKSFIFIESAGDPNAVSSAGAVGLMQLKPDSASDVLVMANKQGLLDATEKATLTKYLGKRFTDGILKMKYLGHKVTANGVTDSVWVTKKDLFNPELNILIGSIYIGMLIDEHTENGVPRFDKIVIRYNRGYFSDKRGKGLLGKLEDIIKSIPTESKSYVLKLLGKNGTLDALV